MWLIISDGEVVGKADNRRDAYTEKERIGADETFELRELDPNWAKSLAHESKRSTVVNLDIPAWADAGQSIGRFCELLEQEAPEATMQAVGPQSILIRWADRSENLKHRTGISEVKYKSAWCVDRQGKSRKWEAAGE